MKSYYEINDMSDGYPKVNVSKCYKFERAIAKAKKLKLAIVYRVEPDPEGDPRYVHRYKFGMVIEHNWIKL